MAQPLANLSIVQVTWWQSYFGQILLNTLHYQFDNGAGAPDYIPEVDALLASVNQPAAISAAMAGCCNGDWELVKIIGQPVYPTRLAARQLTVGSVGLRPGTSAPPNVAAVITKKTDFATRWGVGSWHQGGLAQADVVGGTVQAGLRALLNSLGDELLVDRDGVLNFTFFPCLWNIGTPARVTPLNGRAIQTTSRVMRRRTVGVGV